MREQVQHNQNPSLSYLLQEQLTEAEKDCQEFEKRLKELDNLINRRSD
jgi:hypothetical protein